MKDSTEEINNPNWRKTTQEEFERGYIDCLNEVLALREQNKKLQEMLEMQLNLVGDLQLKYIELDYKYLTTVDMIETLLK